MVKNNRLKPLLIVGPPIALLIIGAAVYISVIKILTPEIDTISAIPNQPQATDSASSNGSATPSAVIVNPIATDVELPTPSELNQWQEDADNGKDIWRLDPISAAEQQAGLYGFIPGDQLTLVTSPGTSQTPSGKATILAMHGGKAYVLTMGQPKKTGSGGIWILQEIHEQS